jgi:hypothetical protein
MATGEAAMKRHASKLKSISLSGPPLLEVSYLTGERYWHQTIFCAYSLAQQLGGKVVINIYSDGTFNSSHSALYHKILPGINIIDSATMGGQIEQLLPERDFPTLRQLREQYPFFRKLVDMRLNNRYVVQLDSDMLFFAYPQELVNAYNTGNYYFMQDTIPASYYVLPENEMNEELNLSIKEKINSGILAYNSADINWNFVEETTKHLLERVPTVHPPRFEQTINAIIISKLNGQPLPPHYRIFYDSKGNYSDNNDVVRHYIFRSKLKYFGLEWRKILAKQ